MDLVVVDDLPEAGEVREVGRALVHENGCAVLQRAVDDVGVAVTQPMSAVHQ